MADIGDVLNVLVQECARAVYPPLPDWDVDGETWDSGEKYDRDIDQVLLAAQAQYDAGLYWDAPNKQWDVPGKVSVSGTDVVIYAGWPASDNLAKDLANKKSH